MEHILYERTKSTPLIDFNPETGHWRIEGKSYPENAFQFYQPIYEWAKEYVKNTDNKKLTFRVFIEYFNTSSSKVLMNLLDLLQDAHEQGLEISMEWAYTSSNELARESGEELKNDYSFPFRFIEIAEK